MLGVQQKLVRHGCLTQQSGFGAGFDAMPVGEGGNSRKRLGLTRFGVRRMGPRVFTPICGSEGRSTDASGLRA